MLELPWWGLRTDAKVWDVGVDLDLDLDLGAFVSARLLDRFIGSLLLRGGGAEDQVEDVLDALLGHVVDETAPVETPEEQVADGEQERPAQ